MNVSHHGRVFYYRRKVSLILNQCNYYFSFFFYLFLFLLLICPQGFLPTENVLTGHQLAHHHLFSWTTALLTGSFSSPNHRQNSSLISHHHSSVWWALSSSKFCSVRLINCPMQQVFFPIKDFLLVKLCPEDN